MIVNTTNRILLAFSTLGVLFGLLFLLLIHPIGGRAEAATLSPHVPAMPQPILVDDLFDFTKVVTRSQNLTLDSGDSSRMDGDSSRAIPTTPTAEWLVWSVDSDGVKEFQAATYHLVDRPITHFKFYISPDNTTYTEISPTVHIPYSADWIRVRYSIVPPQGTQYIKVQFPGGLPIDRNPRQLGAVSYGDPIPFISSNSPQIGPNDRPISLDIKGGNFVPGAKVWLKGITNSLMYTLPNVVWVNDHHLRATIPVSITPQFYNLRVENMLGSGIYRINAYRAVDPASLNDLYAERLDFRVEPSTIRIGDSSQPQLSLNVHRRGGQGDLNNVEVAFYDGNPAAGGIFLGNGIVESLTPYGQATTTSVPWTPFSRGEYTLYAIIDPANQITETTRANNVISRTITIYPALPIEDTTPPQIDGLTINGGDISTPLEQVLLNLNASDNPGGLGVRYAFFVEYAFDQNEEQWARVAVSDPDGDGEPGWVPYQDAISMSWRLQPIPGIHYLQVWVADGAGNISAPTMSAINLVPSPGFPTAFIAQDEIHIYRLPLQAGQSLAVNLTSVNGDADLYVWRPDGTAEGIQETGNPVESVNFTAATSGMYQIEVAGFTNARYTLEFINSLAKGQNQVETPLRRPRGEPLTVPDTTPTEDVGIPNAPVALPTLYLPLAIH